MNVCVNTQATHVAHVVQTANGRRHGVNILCVPSWTAE